MELVYQQHHEDISNQACCVLLLDLKHTCVTLRLITHSLGCSLDTCICLMETFSGQDSLIFLDKGGTPLQVQYLVIQATRAVPQSQVEPLWLFTPMSIYWLMLHVLPHFGLEENMSSEL